jgi:hypothetical protein
MHRRTMLQREPSNFVNTPLLDIQIYAHKVRSMKLLPLIMRPSYRLIVLLFVFYQIVSTAEWTNCDKIKRRKGRTRRQPRGKSQFPVQSPARLNLVGRGVEPGTVSALCLAILNIGGKKRFFVLANQEQSHLYVT